MNGDIFATKGLEYLIVVVYLVLLVLAVRYLAPAPVPQAAGARRARRGLGTSWFSLAEGYHFHQGHSWASAADRDLVTVGLDDFAAQLVGTADAVTLPAVGANVRQGGPGWELRAGGRTLQMVSPVEGTVVAVNRAVLDAPQRAAEDPYGEGWLLKVRPANRQVTLRNLLSGELASAWMQQTVERLRRMPAGGLGVVMPDGGVPVRGFGRALGQEEWDAVSREFFLSE
jgi:glycine cleavage system H protein